MILQRCTYLFVAFFVAACGPQKGPANATAFGEMRQIGIYSVTKIKNGNKAIKVPLDQSVTDITLEFNRLLQELIDDGSINSGALAFYFDGDPWGRNYRVLARGKNAHNITLIFKSAGFDGLFDSADDDRFEIEFDQSE